MKNIIFSVLFNSHNCVFDLWKICLTHSPSEAKLKIRFALRIICIAGNCRSTSIMCRVGRSERRDCGQHCTFASGSKRQLHKPRFNVTVLHDSQAMYFSHRPTWSPPPKLNDQYESHMLVIVKINACIDMSRRRTELGEVDFISL